MDMTPLGAYLAEKRLTRTAFARKLGAPVPMVSMWARGVTTPGLRWALEIDRVTLGVVPATAWVTAKPKRNSRKRRRAA